MKKTLIIISLSALSTLGWVACQPADNSAKDAATIDSLANIKITAMRDSMKMECSAMCDSMGTAKADSMIDAANHMSGKKPNPKKDAPKVEMNKGDIKIVNPAPTDPKSSKMNGGTSTSTQDKTNKMNGSTTPTSSTENKKDKMNKPK